MEVEIEMGRIKTVSIQRSPLEGLRHVSGWVGFTRYEKLHMRAWPFLVLGNHQVDVKMGRRSFTRAMIVVKIQERIHTHLSASPLHPPRLCRE